MSLSLSARAVSLSRSLGERYLASSRKSMPMSPFYSAFPRRSFMSKPNEQTAPPVVIRGGTVVNADSEFPADVYCVDGKIHEVGLSLSVPDGTREIDATGKYVIPGGVEPHTHMEMPFMGTTSIDDYHSGTQCAVAGGTTCLLDFVIPQKGQSILEAHEIWTNRATPKINCDIGFHMALTWWGDEVAKEMEVLTNERGVQSYKMFLAYNGVLRMYDNELLSAFRRIKELRALAQVHAENGDMVDDGQARMIELGITGPEGHPMSRPEAVEAEATHRAIAIADQTNTPLYVVHVMSKSASNEIQRAKNEGVKVFGEPLAVALAKDGREMWNKDWRHAAGYVMSPPIREDPDTKRHLMNMLKSGVLDCVATDNCTFSANQKALGKDDFRLIPNGCNGIEDRMSVVWNNGVKGNFLTRKDFVRVTSTRAAQLFNLYPRKGLIAPGADADVVVWDGDATRTISKDTHYHAVDFNVFEGMKVQGVAKTTLSRGKVVWHNGEMLTENGWGKIVKRQPGGFAYEDHDVREAFKNPLNRKVERAPYTGPVIQIPA
eukprot:TRINITY_DN5416_c0_g1_i1.p1 TRINITY_DN5416_c0_g1~~TRINITY_DN5416_c0_g1_i1.p1  ORF type:complete len:547 (-),score=127.90 TRINITY_DN5416_c0_g1_i1:167-1807(-)